jgi:hypothetical protein|tara:strand:+ start:2269 stop:2430 length:162 start_codon:yes stop_codon:yes gene_type:complete
MPVSINGMSSVIQDLLDLLHEDWMPERKQEAIKKMLMDVIDRMDGMENNDPWQ